MVHGLLCYVVLAYPVSARLNQLSFINWFWDVVITTNIHALFPVIKHCMRSQGDYWNRRATTAKKTHQTVAIHFWHLHINQQNVEWSSNCLGLNKHIQCDLAIIGSRDSCAGFAKYEFNETLVVYGCAWSPLKTETQSCVSNRRHLSDRVKGSN